MPVKFLVCVHEVLPRLDWKLGVVDRERLGLDGVVPKVDLEVFMDGIEPAPIPDVLIKPRASAAPLTNKKAAMTANALRNIIISFAIDIQDVVHLKYAAMSAPAIETIGETIKPSFNPSATLMWELKKGPPACASGLRGGRSSRPR